MELRNRVRDEKGFFKSIINLQVIFTYFKDKKWESKNYIQKNFDTGTTKLESVYIYSIVGATPNSVTKYVTDVGLVVVPISAGIACGRSIRNQIEQERVFWKSNEFEKQ